MRTDRDGLYSEVVVWSPADGFGKSSFGHASAIVNGRNYSFGEKGWDKKYPNSPAGYIARQQEFRSGFGYGINLRPENEALFQKCLDDNVASNPSYSILNNNVCTSPIEQCLRFAGAKLGGYDNIFPADLGDSLQMSPFFNNPTYYPKNGQGVVK
jgi:hypothetical protein